MRFTPIRTNSIQEAICEQLVNAIVSGQIRPGEQLTLESISTQFNVSMMPVREAFRKLEALKLVKRERNRSIGVAELSVHNIEEISEIRLILECHAARKAAQIRSDKAMDRLEALHNAMAVAKGVDKYLKLNRDFHFTIYEEAKLPILMEIINSLWDRCSPYFYILLRNESKRPAQVAEKAHQGMLTAMQNKDAKRVQFCLMEDVRVAMERVARMIEGRRKRQF